MTERAKRRTTDVLWRGNWATRTRIVTGLVLLAFAFFHFLNIGMGLFSPAALNAFQDMRHAITRSLLGETILLLSLLLHGGLALGRVAGRRTLRMPLWEAAQLVLGLLIPFLLLTHIVHTGVAHRFFGVNDRMSYIMSLLWGSGDGWKQAALMLIVWTHGCMGLHYWLRLKPWWRQAGPWVLGAGLLVPAFALAGFLTEGRRLRVAFGDPDTRAALMQSFNWPSPELFDRLYGLSNAAILLFALLLALALAVHLARRLAARRRLVRIRYVDGPEIAAPRGQTLLEMAQANGVSHTALCGGRGRCTTCRVIFEEGGDTLPPPSPSEARSLAAVNAPPNARLACQVRPAENATVFRVFRPEGARRRAHASQGRERRLAILFLDMRGFTARTTGHLPYDVVFLLNRFFDAIVPSITGAGGTVDKYLGDGLMAVFDTPDTQGSARAALAAAAGVGSALEVFNRTLTAEGVEPVRIGIGVHLGDLVLGEIGAAGNAPPTIIGDSVNAASRLEGATKELKVELLISRDVLEAAGRCLPETLQVALTLRGVKGTVTAYAVKRAAQIDLLMRETDSDRTAPDTAASARTA